MGYYAKCTERDLPVQYFETSMGAWKVAGEHRETLVPSKIVKKDYDDYWREHPPEF